MKMVAGRTCFNTGPRDRIADVLRHALVIAPDEHLAIEIRHIATHRFREAE